MQSKWIKLYKLLIIALLFYSARILYFRHKNEEPVIPQTGRFESASKGIEWLLQMQKASGLWSSENAHSDAVNALATLALLNAPEPVDFKSREQAIASLKERFRVQKLKKESLFSDPNQYFVFYTLYEIQKQKPDAELKALLESVGLNVNNHIFSSVTERDLYEDFRASMTHRSNEELASLWATQNAKGFWTSGSIWSAELGDVYETALSVLAQVPKS